MRRGRRIFFYLFAVSWWVSGADGPVSEAKIERRDFVKHLVFSGDLEAAESITINAPNVTSTFMFTISHLAEEGSRVQPGDLVVEFDTSELDNKRLDLEKKLEEARIKIAQKEAEIETRRQDLLLNHATAEKTLKVAELYIGMDPQLVTRADAEKREFEHSKAKLELDKVQERLETLEKSAEAELEVVRLEYKQADLELSRLLSELERMIVRAPIPGLVIYSDSWQQNRKVQKGDTVYRGQPVILLPNMDQVRVVAQVYDSDFPSLREGMRGEVIPDAAPGRAFEGRLLQLPKAASPKTFQSQLKMFRVQVLLLEKDLAVMKPGMTARVRVPVVEKGSWVVPRAAIHLNSRGETYLKLKENPPAQLLTTVVDANDRYVRIVPRQEGAFKEGQPILLNLSAASKEGKDRIEWIPIKREDLTFTVPGNGAIAAAKSVEIRPPANIENFRSFKIVRMVDEGATVKEGDFLVEFDRSEVQRRLREAQANHQKAQQEFQKTQSSLELNVKDAELQLEEARVQREKAENKLVQAREFEGFLKLKEAEYEAILARKRVEMLEKKLASIRKSTGLQLQMLKDTESFYQRRVKNNQGALETMVVHSPAAGIVIYQANWNNEKKQVGSTAHFQDMLLAIPDLNSLKIDGQVSEVDAWKVRKGQRVSITFDAIPEKTFQGRISETSTIFKQASYDRPVKVFEIKIKLENIDPVRMRPGMVARLQIIVDSFDNVVAVPLSVIHVENGNSYVWLKAGDRTTKRPVKVGKNNGLVGIIESGLREGDSVAGRPLS